LEPRAVLMMVSDMRRLDKLQKLEAFDAIYVPQKLHLPEQTVCFRKQLDWVYGAINCELK
jgi:hypothetical protein